MKTMYSTTPKQLKNLLTLIFVVLSIVVTQAQNNVGIGTITPNNKAILELQATNKGFLAPRLTTAQMNLIAPASTESGLLVYNTDSLCYHFYNGTSWKNMCGLDTAILNKAIKKYLSGVNFSIFINNLTVDSSKTNYAYINNANINNLTVDSSKTNYAYINNAVINNLIVDSSITNYAYINNANINNLTVDSSKTNYAYINNANVNNLTVDSSNTNYAYINNANVNNLTVDSSNTNYAYINNANVNNLTVDSSIANYSQSNIFKGGWASLDSIQIGGKNISSIISDSISAQAWLLKGNNASANNKLGTLNAQNLHIVANSVEKITLLQGTGFVGVNQTLPSQQLDVVGNVQFSGALMPANLPGTTGQILTSAGAGVSPTWTSSTNINTNTIAGTGTTTPLLVLNGTTGGLDIVHRGSTAQGVVLIDPSNGCWKLTVSATGALVTQSVTCP
ncbi:MAG: hypothetical protein H7331_08115 [Bacteroidia bacterium]|nr:hypothetical protein [Bacteroidia bacterium]